MTLTESHAAPAELATDTATTPPSPKPARRKPPGSGKGRGHRQAIVNPLTPPQQQLVLDNQGWAYRLAHQYATYSTYRRVPLDDLIGASIYGMCVAASRFDPARGFQFTTYAHNWVTRYLREVRYYHQIVRQPKHHDTNTKTGAGRGWPKCFTNIMQTHGRSNDKDFNDPGLCVIVEAKPDSTSRVAREDLHPVMELIDRLPRKERDIMIMRHGLEGTPGEVGVEMTLDETGAVIGITRERVRQLQSRATTRLRRMIARSGMQLEEYL